MTPLTTVALLHTGTFDWRVWKLYPSFMVGWLLFGAVYFLCVGPLRHRFPGSKPATTGQVACFSGALLAMVLSAAGAAARALGLLPVQRAHGAAPGADPVDAAAAPGGGPRTGCCAPR